MNARLPSPRLRSNKFAPFTSRLCRGITKSGTSDLNKSINDTLAQKGKLSDTDIDDIYSAHLASSRVSNQIDTPPPFGDKPFRASLADARELQGASDGAALRVVTERLVTGAKEMELSNKKLESRLTASRQQIELEVVRTESLADPLTTLANRKFFDVELGKAAAEARQNGEPLTLLMCDVDHFKAFNDKFGHVTGDPACASLPCR